MYVPLLTPWLEFGASRLEVREGRVLVSLVRVRGVGGGGGGGGGGGKGGGSSGGGSSGGSSSGDSSSSSGGSSSSGSNKSGGNSSGSSASSGRTSPASIKSASGSTASVRSYGSGSTLVATIPSGQLFAGRTFGGGTRSDVFGTRKYGSGYPGISTPGIAGRSFPFGFWPITYGEVAGLYTDSEFQSNEYGDPTNSSRPGGPLFDAPFQPPDASNTYRVLSDNTTVQELIESITANCSLSTTSIIAVPYNTSDPTQPKPEQVIQYYRSSSIALTLDGYNNTAVFSSDANASDTPLPSNLNDTFLDCLNQTIGLAAPLLDAAAPNAQMITGLFGLTLLVSHLLGV